MRLSKILIVFVLPLLFFKLFHVESDKVFVPYEEGKGKALSTIIKSQNIGRNIASLESNNIVIEQGQIFYLDQDLDIDTLTINGQLHCDPKYAPDIVELKVKTIIINGIFQCGADGFPYEKKLIISLKHSEDILPPSGHYRGIIVHHGGRLVLSGSQSRAGWYKLSQTAYPGDNFIEVSPAKDSTRPYARDVPLSDKWNYGDKIVIGPTGYNPFEAEEFNVVSVEGNRVYLDGKIRYQHWGELSRYQTSKGKSVVVDERAEVANLTRSIVIRADESQAPIGEGDGDLDQIGGHVMAHHMGKIHINSVEFYKMGQAGIMARYPIHWHYVGDASGQFVINSSIHHSYQRCLAIHRTNNVLVKENVCYNFKGHGYFLEDGTEQGNKIIRNLAILAKAPSENKVLLASDDIKNSESQGRFPSVSAFWISHPNNEVTHNIVSGSVGSGIWMSFEEEVLNSVGEVVARPAHSKTLSFNHNQAHTCKVGITWDGAPGTSPTNNPRNPEDRKLISSHYRPPVIPIFNGLVAWKNSQTGIYFRGQSAIFQNSVVSDNGWSYWLAYNQIVKDSYFIGESDNQSDQYMDDYYNNNGRKRKSGIVLYDGPFEVHNSEFLNFSTSKKMCSRNNGPSFDCTSVAFTSTASTNKFTNIVSGIGFNPYPIHRTYLESSSEEFESSQLLGNSILRDLDGTLSGTGKESVIVGNRSLGKAPDDKCLSGDETFYNFDICPSQYSEGSFAFMRWGAIWNGISPWQSHFIVLRNDGATNYPIQDWNRIRLIQNNLFATSNNPRTSYTILPNYNYLDDRNFYATSRIDANSEGKKQYNPVVRIEAYGNNCRLVDARKVDSLSDLRASTESSYYSRGVDFFVKLVPSERWFPIESSSLVMADAVRTQKRYAIKCDDTPIEKKVLGELESVVRDEHNTILRGYACNYTAKNAIKVRVYLRRQRKQVSANSLSRKLSRPSKKFEQIFITERLSNLTPDPVVSVACGELSSRGKKFRITIPNSKLDMFDEDYKFMVMGLSNSGGEDVVLKNSDTFFNTREM